ncbi:MAG: FecR domain-containing protein [Planctomycetes bacterium]|nr:FecR domain-containing protein [Planctomycetota bacterium]
MSEHRDLRDALAPLAGDPVADAGRVLAALPELQPAAVRPARPMRLVAAAAGVALVVGAGVGWWLGRALPPAAPTAGWPSPTKETPGGRDPRNYGFEFFGFGTVQVLEPGTPPQELQNRWGLAYGSVLRTGKSHAGLLLRDDVQVRLDIGTHAEVVAPRSLVLQTGQMWLAARDAPQLVVVKTPSGLVDVERAVAMIEVRDGRVRVTCLQGQVRVRPRGAAAQRLAVGEQVAVDAGGQQVESCRPEFLDGISSWMTEMIVEQVDTRERDQRATRMVEAYLDGRFRKEARRELFRLGPAAVPALAGALRDHPELPPELARETARMVCSMATTRTKRPLFELLYSADPEVRVLVARRIGEVTDVPYPGGVEFWRGASDPKVRQSAVLEWWGRVR